MREENKNNDFIEQNFFFYISVFDTRHGTLVVTHAEDWQRAVYEGAESSQI